MKENVLKNFRQIEAYFQIKKKDIDIKKMGNLSSLLTGAC